MGEQNQLTIKQTPTGYWTVRRGAVDVAGAMTRKGAEAERELLERLGGSRIRRAGAQRIDPVEQPPPRV